MLVLIGLLLACVVVLVVLTQWFIRHERIHAALAATQNLVVTLAVVTGGLWTVYTFGLVDWAERERLNNSGLGIGIEAKQEPFASGGEYVIVAQVKVTNRAAGPRFVDFEKAPLRVQKVKFDGGLSIIENPPVREQPNLHATSRVIRGGETVEYPYVVTVKEKGAYRVTLWVKLTDEEFAIHLASGGPAGEPRGEIYWDGQALVFVQ